MLETEKKRHKQASLQQRMPSALNTIDQIGSDPRGSTPHGELAVLSEEGVCGQNTETLGKARLAEMGEAHSRQREPQGREPCGGQLGESKDGEEGTQNWRRRKGPDHPGTRKTRKRARKGSAFYSEIRCRRETQSDIFLNGVVGIRSTKDGVGSRQREEFNLTSSFRVNGKVGRRVVFKKSRLLETASTQMLLGGEAGARDAFKPWSS